MNTLTTSDWAAFNDLPLDLHNEVDRWRRLCAAAQKPIEPTSEDDHTSERYWAVRAAREMGCSWKTAARKFYAWQKHGWQGLVNKARCPRWAQKWANPEPDAFYREEARAEFIQFIKSLAHGNQRKTAPAWRKFQRLWHSGAEIPGLDNSLPRDRMPKGCSYATFCRLTKDAFATHAARFGLGGAIGACGPMVFSTRVGLWPGSHLMIDDLWHDNFVIFNGKPVRVLELDILDVFSGCKTGWGCKPRFQREDGTFDNLKEKYARLIVAQYFARHGFSPRGTIILAEHGTAAISEYVAKILFDRTGGLVRLRESGMTGAEQAIAGMWGQGKGNYRFKAALESLRNLIHNELGDVRGQTGKDVLHRPEFLHGQLKDADDLLKAVAVLMIDKPERARLIRHGLLEYHAEFLPLLGETYERINRRNWHALEGWHECGHVTVKYRTRPDSNEWLLPEAFAAQPQALQRAVLEMIETDPRYVGEHVMSPHEVFATHDLQKLPPFVIAELLAEDYARELEVCGAYFKTFQDVELSPEPLLYESVITNLDGQRVQLKDDRYTVFSNPFALEQLYVQDAAGVTLGVARRAAKINRLDPDAINREFGVRSRRLRELLVPIRATHTQMVREESNRLEHNANAIAGETRQEQAQRLTEQQELAALAREARMKDFKAPQQNEDIE